MTHDLDALLAQPLAEIPDNGFSARTMALVELQRLRRSRLRTEIYAGLVVLAVLVLPFTPLGATLGAAAFTKAGTMLTGAAFAAIVLAALWRQPSSTHLAV